jgi:hypothetical protein
MTLRPYSLALFLISIPISYIAFMLVVWGVAVVPHVGPESPSLTAAFAVVSFWYVLSCYAWIPATWLVGSVGITVVRRRRGNTSLRARSERSARG